MKKEQETYKLYLQDLVSLLKEDISNMHRFETISNDFEAGIKFGKANVLGLIVSQANAFQIDLEEIGLKDFEEWQKQNDCIT